MEKTRVLIVDDHPVVREGISRPLEMDDRIQVVGQVESAEDAFTRIREVSPKVVLMDIKLPGANGVEATRQLVADNPSLRVVVLSSFGDHYLSSAIEAGTCGYVLKTATQQELVDAVLQAAAGRSPIDPSLSGVLFDRFAKMAKTSQERGLTSRQREMLKLVADGFSSKEIGAQLFISEPTVKREFRNIFNFLGANDRAQAIAEAYKRNLI